MAASQETESKAETVDVSSQACTMDVQQVEENGDSGEPQPRLVGGSENSNVMTEKMAVKSPPSSPARKEEFMTAAATAKSSIFHHRRDSSTAAKKSFMSLVDAAVAAAARAESQHSSVETTPAMDAVAAGAAAAAQTNNASTIKSAKAMSHPILQKGDNSLSSISSSNTKKKQQQDRKISWHGNVRTDSRVLLSLSSSSLSSGKMLTITDLVKQVNPLEQQAETHIISSIEDMEAMDKSRGEEDTPKILEFVPQGAESVFSDFANNAKRRSVRMLSFGADTTASVGQRTTQSRQPAVRPERPTHRRNKTSVEEDLFSLGNALQALSRPLQALSRSDHLLPPSGAQQQQQPVPAAPMPYRCAGGGSADRLAANAALLFRRRRSTEVLVDADGQVGASPLSVASDIAIAGRDEAVPTTMTVSPAAKSRCKKQNTNVQAGQALKNKKKTDDEQQASGTFDTSSGGDHHQQQQQQQPGDSFDMEIGGVADIRQTNDSTEGGSSPTSTKETTAPDGGKKKRPVMSFLRGKLVMVSDYRNKQRDSSVTFFSLLVVLVGIACILFYLAGNPPTGIITFTYAANGTITGQSPVIIDPTLPSHSWWFLFAARQLTTFALAVASEFIIIDVFCLHLRWINFFRSPLLTLLFVQSRGWPFRATSWAIYDFLLLQGDDPFAAHWLFYQRFLLVFTYSNPGGMFTSNLIYTRVLILFIGIGVATSCKRVYVGFMQGKRVFATYGEEVASLMRKVLLISQIGILARDIEMKAMIARPEDEDAERSREDIIWKNVEQICDEDASKATGLDDLLDPVERDGITRSFSQSQEMEIIELLGDWEDPEANPENGSHQVERNISVTSILQFRQSLEFFGVPDMFGYYFGPTDTRSHCVESSEEVYNRLLLRSNGGDALSFHVLAMLALHADGTLKQEKVKELIHMFRPDRDGTLSVLDFVKSVDAVYKKMKLLRATIKKTQRLDEAMEHIFNVGFFIVVSAVSLVVLGIDAMALFLYLGSIMVGAAFLIGSASAKYFEGLLFILVRKPYGVGDRVFFNIPEDETSPNGSVLSAGWFVRDITLYHTTLVYGTTNEYCTVSNGSIANLRVINAARSPKAVLYIFLKFGTEVPWSKIQIFEDSLRAFVKSRPREWLGVNGFRTSRVETDLGFHEMVVVLQHRESWQNVVALLVSKAEVSAFCHELQKKMDMKYKSPPLPVDLNLNQSANALGVAVNDRDIGQAVVAKLGVLSAPGSGSDFEAVAKLFGTDSEA